MKKLLAIVSIAAAFFMYIFFRNYKGTMIPMAGLWYVLSFLLLMTGIYLLTRSAVKSSEQHLKNVQAIVAAENEQLKRTGEKVRVTLENTEIKKRDYEIKEEVNEYSYGNFFDRLRNSKPGPVGIRQTYLVFRRNVNGHPQRFVSHALAHTPESLKLLLIENDGVDLYINPNNTEQYFFDIS